MQVVKRLTHVLVIVLTLIVGATAAAIIVSQTAWFKNRLRGYIVREANQYLNGTVSIQRLGGSLFFGIEMENIAVSMDGTDVVAVKDLGLDYNVFEFISRGLSVDSIRLDKPVIYLRREGDTWSLSRLVKKQETEADSASPDHLRQTVDSRDRASGARAGRNHAAARVRAEDAGYVRRAARQHERAVVGRRRDRQRGDGHHGARAVGEGRRHRPAHR